MRPGVSRPEPARAKDFPIQPPTGYDSHADAGHPATGTLRRRSAAGARSGNPISRLFTLTQAMKMDEYPVTQAEILQALDRMGGEGMAGTRRRPAITGMPGHGPEIELHVRTHLPPKDRPRSGRRSNGGSRRRSPASRCPSARRPPAPGRWRNWSRPYRRTDSQTPQANRRRRRTTG